MSGPNRYTEGLVEVADAVASTTATNGEIRFNLGDSSTGSGVASDVCFWGTDGFLSRPVDPDANGSAQMLFINDGNQRRIVGSRDRRFYDGLETIDGGDRMVYSPCGIRVRLDESEQAIEQIIPGGTKHYVSSDLVFTAIASGTTLEIGLSTIDAKKLGTPESVALYATLQECVTQLQGLVDLICVGQPDAIPAPVPGILPTLIAASLIPGPLQTVLVAALAASYAQVVAANLAATNPLLASSAILRASPT